jgi:hypothetical protein
MTASICYRFPVFLILACKDKVARDLDSRFWQMVCDSDKQKKLALLPCEHQ